MSTTTPANASPSASADPTRPEGPWTLVAWTTKRSDGAANPAARVLLTTLTPACATGACDLTLAPAGTDGGYREPEAPVTPDGSPKPAAYTLTWDGTSYKASVPSRLSSCNPTGQVADSIPNGYSVARTVALTFVAASGDLPARVHGTITTATTGTKASRAKGCTDFVETETFAGSPTGSLDAATALDGEYDASLSSTGSTPKTLAPVGQPLWLGQMRVAAGGKGLTGLTASEAPLTSSGDGWGGTAPAAPFECRDPRGTSSPKGADAVEAFTGLHPLAVTAEGKPVFAGTWTLRANPNATGVKAGCSLAAYEGRIYLVPHGAGK